MSYTKIMPRGGTKYEWSVMNPVLAEREMAVEYPDSGIGTGLCRFKFGDGFKTYNELPYAFDGSSASSMIGGSAFSGNLFQIRADTYENWLLANPVLEENELVYDTTNHCFYLGDGSSRISQLEPAGRDKQRIYDFGDDDEDNIISPITGTASGAAVTAGVSMFSAGTSTLGDLMDVALGGMIEPQSIESGEPLILGQLSVDNAGEPEMLEETETDLDEESVDDGYSIPDEKDYDEVSETTTTVEEFLEKNADIAEVVDEQEE